MKSIASLFTAPMKEALKEQLGVELSDHHDYSVDELETIYDRITEEFPLGYDASGAPVGLTKHMEDMIDVFVKNKLIRFN